MRGNRRTTLSIKGIIYVTLVIILLALTANLFSCNTNVEIAQADNQTENMVDNNENLITEISSVSSTLEVSSRGQATTREKNEENANENNIVEPVLEEQQQIKYKTIEEVVISKDMDLTVRTGLSKEDFKTLIATVKEDTSKFFYNNADIIYDLCEKYELNEIFFCGLISAESGWNIASNHRNTHNYISLMSNGKLLKYNSVEEGLEVAAKTLHNKYLTKGGVFYYGKTLSAVKTKFCPASTTWVDLVYGRMKQIRY